MSWKVGCNTIHTKWMWLEVVAESNTLSAKNPLSLTRYLGSHLSLGVLCTPCLRMEVYSSERLVIGTIWCSSGPGNITDDSVRCAYLGYIVVWILRAEEDGARWSWMHGVVARQGPVGSNLWYGLSRNARSYYVHAPEIGIDVYRCVMWQPR